MEPKMINSAKTTEYIPSTSSHVVEMHSVAYVFTFKIWNEWRPDKVNSDKAKFYLLYLIQHHLKANAAGVCPAWQFRKWL